MKRYTHLGWEVSPYSAKTRSYLRYKGIPHIDRAPNVVELFGRVARTVGRPIMPTLITPEGSLWQDSSEIIDGLEARFPSPSIHPPGATQRLASYLLELHADEWLPMPALHYRWNVPENTEFAYAEFGRSGLPYFPRRLQRAAGRKVAASMRRYLPILGIDQTHRGIEAFTVELIARLDAHLEAHDYLLGARPCLGDFALFGPLWAHLYRDPGTTPLFDGAPHLRDWMQRMERPPAGERGDFLPDDQVPESLDPIFRTIFAEQMAYVSRLVEAIDAYCEAHPDAKRVPRALGDAEYTVGGVTGRRKLITFTQWMVQRPMDAYADSLGDARARVDRWLERVDGLDAMQRGVAHRLARRDYREVLE